MTRRMIEFGCRSVLVEDQFVGRNPQSAIRTIEARMRVEVCARLSGLKVIRVPANVWQTEMLYVAGERFPVRKAGTKRLLTHIPPTEVLKARSMELARTHKWHGDAIVIDDEADAICLGAYAVKRAKRAIEVQEAAAETAKAATP